MDVEHELKELVPALPKSKVKMGIALVILDFFVLEGEVSEFSFSVVDVDESLVHFHDKEKFFGCVHLGMIN